MHKIIGVENLLLFQHKWADGEKDAEIIFKQLSPSGIDFLHVTEYHADAPAFDEKGSSLA